MKVAIIFFSGTGNTEAIAKGYECALTKAGHQVTVQTIEGLALVPDHDILIVGGPIYAGNMPDELIQWVRKSISKTESPIRAIVFSTSAGLTNVNGVNSIGKKLMRKGYTLLDLPTYEMPRNFYINKYDPTPEAVQKEQFEKATVGIIHSISQLETDTKLQFNMSVFMADLMADVFRIMAKYLGKSYHINENCINCGKCEANCPKKNIDHRNKQYSNQCMMCTRCIHNCPVNAIGYKGKTIVPYRVHYDIQL